MRNNRHNSVSYPSTDYILNEEGIPIHKDDYQNNTVHAKKHVEKKEGSDLKLQNISAISDSKKH